MHVCQGWRLTSDIRFQHKETSNFPRCVASVGPTWSMCGVEGNEGVHRDARNLQTLLRKFRLRYSGWDASISLGRIRKRIMQSLWSNPSFHCKLLYTYRHLDYHLPRGLPWWAESVRYRLTLSVPFTKWYMFWIGSADWCTCNLYNWHLLAKCENPRHWAPGCPV